MSLEHEELTGKIIGAAIEVRSYLRALGREHGLILNFSKSTLEVKRVIASPWPPEGFGR